ncbi:hypothetical protein [Kribbella sp. NPDC055071]
MSTPAEGPQTGTATPTPAAAVDTATMFAQLNERIAALQTELAEYRAAQTPAPAAPQAEAATPAAAQSPSRGGRWGRVARRSVMPAAVAGVYSQTESGQQNLSALSGWASDRWAEAWGAGADLVKSINENVVQPAIQGTVDFANSVNDNVIQPAIHGTVDFANSVNDNVIQPAIHAGAVAIDATGQAIGATTEAVGQAATWAANGSGPAHTVAAVATGAALAAAATPRGQAVIKAVASAVRHPGETMRRLVNAIRSNPESAAAAASPREVQQAGSELAATGTETPVPNAAEVGEQLSIPGLNVPALDPALAPAGSKIPEQSAQTPATTQGEAQQTGAAVSTNTPDKGQGK